MQVLGKYYVQERILSSKMLLYRLQYLPPECRGIQEVLIGPYQFMLPERGLISEGGHREVGTLSVSIRGPQSYGGASCYTPHPQKAPVPGRQPMGKLTLPGVKAGTCEWTHTLLSGSSAWFGRWNSRATEFLVILHITCLCSPFHKDSWMVTIVNVYWMPPCAKDCAKQSRLFLLILTTSLSVDPVIIPMLSLRNLRNREVKGVQLISDRAGIQIFLIGFQLHTLIAPKG